jgi:deoxyribonuclease (pyrimidine dimer)
MTRVNTGILVEQLTDEHLIAEHREIKRFPSLFQARLIKYGIFKWNTNLTKEFTLNKGHVLFFIDKPIYTLTRYKQLHQECLNRGIKVTDYSSNWDIYFNSIDIVQKNYINSYVPSKKDKQLLVDRISIRIKESTIKGFKYNRKSIERDKAIEMLNT